jgi:hypothetical protein
MVYFNPSVGGAWYFLRTSQDRSKLEANKRKGVHFQVNQNLEPFGDCVEDSNLIRAKSVGIN